MGVELHHKEGETVEHLVVPSENKPKWKRELTLCGRDGLGHGTVRKNPNVAARVAENLCDECRRNASEEMLMRLYENADESEKYGGNA